MFKNSPRVYRSDARTGLRMPLLLVGVQLERVAVLDSGPEWTKNEGTLYVPHYLSSIFQGLSRPQS
ncbi:hypothetical protein ALO95_102226 [Pseudomonas syringae pv. antirrhini]|uniref:Uncharacterized protein n=1 Tax=Pseudomonas syringae pv. antirrhini TaxID=251702 RepID=A0A0P9JUP1_9PSED|nr:hypothetical protein ALO88_102626 [Pseudomonas syringae pv. antirrhini]RMP28515.1 hypothetical protein ALQ24_102744 [Pseudomonas syringae pv. antirrhini]RMP40217.1 hypothetical protein ALQ23_102431 [Pseudomonas syringae pv. antirrhini]RMW21555.1 hypothetical protein ALO95_102226 [Pseudomonas syringae pv. antirrhini]